MKKVWNIAVNIVLVILLLVGLFLLVSFIPQSKYKILSVMSGSMEPTINTGAVVITWPVEDYRVDDVITYKSQEGKQDEYTTHRIERKENKAGNSVFYTKGDANETADTNYVPKDRVVGKVVASVDYLGYVVTYAKTLPGIIVIIVLATLIINDEFKKIRNEYSDIKKNRKASKKNLGKSKNSKKSSKKKTSSKKSSKRSKNKKERRANDKKS